GGTGYLQHHEPAGTVAAEPHRRVVDRRYAADVQVRYQLSQGQQAGVRPTVAHQPPPLPEPPPQGDPGGQPPAAPAAESEHEDQQTDQPPEQRGADSPYHQQEQPDLSDLEQ